MSVTGDRRLDGTSEMSVRVDSGVSWSSLGVDMRLIPGPKSRDRRVSPEELLLTVPALSFDVTHWTTTAEKRTAGMEQRVSRGQRTEKTWR